MPGPDKSNAIEVSRLLAGAAKTMKSARYCWLVTAGEDGCANLRPMGLLRDADDGKQEWAIRLITDARSRKSADIRRCDKVTIIIQRDADDAFVRVRGKATLYESESEVRKRWKQTYDRFVPSEADRANAIFIGIEIEVMELWIRGLTDEPFGPGMRSTILERDSDGSWRAVA